MTMITVSRRFLSVASFCCLFLCAFAQNPEAELLNQELERLQINSMDAQMIQNRLQHMACVEEGSDDWFYSAYVLSYSYCVSLTQDFVAAKALLDRASALNETVNSGAYATGMTALSWANYYMGTRDYEPAIQKTVSAVQAQMAFPQGREYERAMIITNFASLLQAIGQYKESLQYFDMAEALFARQGTTRASLALASLYCNRGVSYRVLGDASKAMEQYKMSDRLFTSLGAQTNVFLPVLYSNMVTAYKEMGDPVMAGIYSDRGLTLAQKIYGHDSYNYASILSSHSGADEADLDSVISFASEAIRILERLGLTNNSSYYRALGNLGYAYGKRGLYKEASQLQLKAVEAMRADPQADAYSLAHILSLLGDNLFLVGDKEKATEVISESLDLLKRKYGEQSELYYVNLVNMATMAGLSDAGMAYLEQALDVMSQAEGTIRRPDVGLLTQLGVRQVEREAYAEAETSLKEALRMAEQLQLTEDRIVIYTHLAQVYLRLGRLDLYEDNVMKAKALCDQTGIQNSFYYTVTAGSLDYYYMSGQKKELAKETRSLVESVREAARDNFSYMTEAERQGYWQQFLFALKTALMVSDKMPDVAYDVALMSKGLLLSSTLELEKIAAESGDPQMVADLAELKEVRSRMASAPDPELQIRAEALENALALASKEYGNLLSSLSYKWKDVQDRLEKGDIAVEFISYEGNDCPVYVVAAIKKGWKAPKLYFRGADPDNTVARAIEGCSVRAFDSEDWYSIFWKGLVKDIKPGAHIYFAPDGVLHKAPLEYVPIGKTGKRMCDVYRMHRLSSTRELVTATAEERLASASIFGGLDYNLSGEEMEMMGEAAVVRSSASLGELAYLPGTLKEASFIARTLEGAGVKVDLITGAAGVESAFKKLSGNAPGIIHIATHGLLREEEDPMEGAGLAFSGINSGFTSGMLTAKEISLMDLRSTRLVVLSACLSGLGKTTAEGIAGLQRAFKKAGAGTLVMTLWEVDDRITEEMMSAFYTTLANGASEASAFSSALASIRQKYPDFSQWAAFVLLK